MNKTVTVIIPAYNPEVSMISLVKKISESRDVNLIVVNDGSDEKSSHVFEQIAGFKNVTLLVHAVNLGKGQALKTAFNFYLLNSTPDLSSGVVTADADGQHRFEDIMRLVDALRDGTEELLLGVREFGKDTPFRSRFGNASTSLISRFLLGKKISDTQTGLRGIKRELLREILKLRSSGYEYEMEMLVLAVNLGVKILEIPISTVYIDGNRSSHFRPVKDSLLIYFVLLRHIANSVLTSIIDYIGFSFFLIYGGSILGSMVFGRVIACAFNFSVGKKFVFKSKNSLKTELSRYLILLVSLMFVSYASIELLYKYLNISPFVSKIFVEILVFVVSFFLQRIFVFSQPDQKLTDWDGYYLSRKNEFSIPRMFSSMLLISEIRKHIDKVDSIVELGGADSCFYKPIRKEFPYARYLVIDKSRVGVEKFNQKHKSVNTNAFCKDLFGNEADFREESSLVFSVGLIEHFQKRETAELIGKHFEIASVNGYVLLSYPTPTFMYRAIRYLAELFGVWKFHDERALLFKEVESEVRKYGTMVSRRMNWFIGLTQEIIIAKKGF